MSHIHIALFKWKNSASMEAVDVALQTIEDLVDHVPGILEIAIGVNNSKYSEGYTHVVLVIGDSQEAMDAYRAHPDHQRAAAVIDAAEDRGIGVDFATEDFKTLRGKGGD